VVKDSINAYHRQVVADMGVARLLEDFIGSAEGPRNLSTDYKTQLTEAATCRWTWPTLPWSSPPKSWTPVAFSAPTRATSAPTAGRTEC
jgi:hypothetical protein